ncbi:hypothetical protein [Nonomuraea guangzhouensis]|uniref:Secreted protein n=1 Tax=Nonomuraea guangzhouensis TaxID=1291555 RepID=A0ABW4GUF1_9ACTN|nr:hypothetical protein [Nonomuraea guangzhouensis]
MKKLLSAIVAAAITLVTLPSGTGAAETSRASASECGSISEQQAAIHKFVRLTKDRLKLSISAHDYEVQDYGEGCIVKPRGSAPVTVNVATDASGRKTVTGQTDTPTPSAIQADGNVTTQAETQWQQPQCWGPFEDAARVGIMQPYCFQWGIMNYVGATRWNYAARVYATCGAREGGPDFWQVYACSVGARPSATSAPMVLNDYSPRGSTTLSGCGSIPLNITAGPVSAGTSLQTCEKLALETSPSPTWPQMEVRWIGTSYWSRDKRETGFLLGIGVPIGGTPMFSLSWTLDVGPCSLPPGPAPYCAL